MPPLMSALPVQFVLHSVLLVPLICRAAFFRVNEPAAG